MKYLIPLFMTLLLSPSLTAQEVKNPPTPMATDTIGDERSPSKEKQEEVQKEEIENEDVLDEFGNNTYNDNGNGATTNRKIEWPEP